MDGGFDRPRAHPIAAAVCSTERPSKNRSTTASRWRSGRSDRTARSASRRSADAADSSGDASGEAPRAALAANVQGGHVVRPPGALTAAAALHLADDVQRDPQRPRPELAVAAEARELSEEPKGRLLGRVAGGVGVAEQAQAEPVPRVLQARSSRDRASRLPRRAASSVASSHVTSSTVASARSRPRRPSVDECPPAPAGLGGSPAHGGHHRRGRGEGRSEMASAARP